MKTVTEIVFTPLGLPHPYELSFVAQYRFVYQTGEFLVRRNDTQQIVGGLARSWTISDDRRHITFHLRPNLYSAEEVAQSLRRLLTAGQTSHSNFTGQIVEIKVVDPLNLELVTRNDAAAVLSPLVMADAVILPDDLWYKDKTGKEQVDWSKTRGPFILESGHFPAQNGEEILYVPNKKHYLYEPEQVAWKILPMALASVPDQKTLKEILSRGPSYCTLRYSNVLKMFSTADSNLKYYQTKPNGVGYIELNRRSSVFSNKAARQTILKKAFSSGFSLLLPELRAFQIPQPGLTGRISLDEEKKRRDQIQNLQETEFGRPIKWSIPSKPEEDSAWHETLVRSLNVPIDLLHETVFPMDKRWKNGEVDAAFLSVGMSDMDPVSSSTFLFSPSGSDADLEDGRLMKELNSAKLSTDPVVISEKIRNVFIEALDQAIIVPLYYVVNRHYYSDQVQLNISDPYAEQVQITKVRLP